MIVCLCHRISDRDIERAVQEGTRNFEVLQDDLLVAASCACCHEAAHEVFDAACERAGCASGCAGMAAAVASNDSNAMVLAGAR